MAKNIDRSLDDVNRSSDEVVRKQREMERAIGNVADNASSDVDSAARDIDRNYDDVNRSSDEVVSNQREMERAIDDVSKNTTADVDSAAKEITSDYEDVGKAADGVKQKHESLGGGAKDVVTGFSGIATAGFSLYNAYDRVSDMTLQVDKANLAAERSANALEDVTRRQTTAGLELEDAQAALNVAIETYGVDSDEARDAQEKLKTKLEEYNAVSADAAIAQDTYNLKVEAAKQTQDNFNEAIIQSAIQIVPTVVTLVDSAGKVWTAFDKIGGVDGIVSLVSSKLSSLKDVDFTPLVTKIGGITTALEGVTASAAAAYAAIGSVVVIGGYASYEYGKAETTTAITGAGGLPATTPSYLGITTPSLGLGSAVTGLVTGGTETTITSSGYASKSAGILDYLEEKVSAKVYSGPSALVDDLVAWVKGAGGTYADAVSMAKSLASSQGWTGSALSAFTALVPKFAEGGTAREDMYALVGERGPEILKLGRGDSVVPLDRGVSLGAPNVFDIDINISGNPDYVTIQQLKAMLRNVIVEASSSGAPSGHNRVRLGSRAG